jgi:hypothetical protein
MPISPKIAPEAPAEALPGSSRMHPSVPAISEVN